MCQQISQNCCMFEAKKSEQWGEGKANWQSSGAVSKRMRTESRETNITHTDTHIKGEIYE